MVRLHLRRASTVNTTDPLDALSGLSGHGIADYPERRRAELRPTRITLRPALLLLLVAALAACGQGAEDREPSGPWSLKGQAVNNDQVESSAGPEHCEWQAAHFLRLSWPPGRTYDDPRRQRMYIKDPGGVLDFAPYLRAGYDGSAALPADAIDTGYRNDGFALWYSPGAGETRVFLVGPDDTVESWPRATTPVGCD